MKKIYLSCMILFVLTLAISINCKAVPVLCEPDCPETPFLSQYPLTCNFQLGNCHFVADYYIRKACSTYCDILLWRVKCIDPPPCNNYPVAQLINIATASIIQCLRNSGDFERITGQQACFPTQPGDCNYNWRVSKASCWKWFQNSSYNATHPPTEENYWGGISYCTTDVCCLTWYKVCMDSLGQIIVTELESNSNGTCPYDPTGQCISICD